MSDAQAAIVVDGSADEIIATMAADGWVLSDEVYIVDGKRIRYMTVGTRDATDHPVINSTYPGAHD